MTKVVRIPFGGLRVPAIQAVDKLWGHSIINSATLTGIDAAPIIVETTLRLSKKSEFLITGLPAPAVKEGKWRVLAALQQFGLPLEVSTTINLSPADVPKVGAALDLPIALGILAAHGKISPKDLSETLVAGELGLNGRIRPIRGTLSLALMARAEKYERVIVPHENREEALVVGGFDVVAPQDIHELVDAIDGGGLGALAQRRFPFLAQRPGDEPDLSEVQGQDLVKEALVLAAVGRFNLLMVGPPGAGKTMLARRFAALLPLMSEQEVIDVTQIWSAAGLAQGLVMSRPFRAPHHTVSAVGLVGGSVPIRPGEVSLAHHGILFLDEICEVPRMVLDGLRAPLEDGEVVITRAKQTMRIPSRFIMIGAMNPCPCGWCPHERCVCTQAQIDRYQSRISGPILDRFDMVVPVPSLPIRQAVQSAPSGETSKQARQRIQTGAAGIAPTASQDMLTEFAEHPEAAMMSARGVHRAISVAKAIARLSGAGEVTLDHMLTALHYRVQ